MFILDINTHSSSSRNVANQSLFIDKRYCLSINFAVWFGAAAAAPGLQFQPQNQQGPASCVCRRTVPSARRGFDHYHQVESAQRSRLMLGRLRRFLETWNTLASTGTTQSAQTRSDGGGGGEAKASSALARMRNPPGRVLLFCQLYGPAFASVLFVSAVFCCRHIHG